MDLYKSTNRFIKNYNFLKGKLKRQPTIEELSDFASRLHFWRAAEQRTMSKAHESANRSIATPYVAFEYSPAPNAQQVPSGRAGLAPNAQQVPSGRASLAN